MTTLEVLAIVVGAVLGVVYIYLKRNDDISLDTSIKDKIRELPAIFEHARETIKIATDFDKRFFNDTRVKKGIKKAIEKGVEIKFLTDQDPPKWYVRQAEKEKLKIKRIRKLPSHWLVVDDRHLRLERPHEPLKFGHRPEDFAYILKNFPRLGKECSQKFDEFWEH